MPHPIPIIIGTTMAVAATGYAFKKFVYDPHLAPVIDAWVEQQRAVRRRRRAVPVPVEEQRIEGRTTAVAAPSGLRQRRPAELYELDESMADVGRAPASYAPHRRRTSPPPPDDDERPLSFFIKRKPVPAAEPEPETAPAAVGEAVPLISIDKDLPRHPMENPFADSARSPSPALSPTISPMPSSAPSAVHSLAASPAFSHATLIEAPTSPSFTSGEIDDMDVVSVSGTNTSYIDAESYTPRSLSPTPRSLSPYPTGSPSASRLASRTLSPAMAGSELTFPSPMTPVTASMLGSDLTFPVPNTVPSPAMVPSPMASGRASPATATDDVLSVSSWTEDDWRSERSDSEWDAVSDAPSRQA